MNTNNNNVTSHERHQNAVNLYMVFRKINANVKTEDRWKGRNRNGGYVSWPQRKNNTFQYETGNHQN